MKKYLMTAIAAVAMGAAFTSCSHSLDVYNSGDEEIEKEKYTAELRQAEYEALFENVFGKPDPNHMWGFESGSAGTRVLTRTITVNGDSYNKFPSADEINANFPTDIPEGAVEVAELETKYKGTTVQTEYGPATLWDLYAIYDKVIVEGFNLKITQAGVTELGGSKNNASDGVAHPYNVYVKVDGDVTIRRNGSTHFNLYVLQGNVTLESDYGEQAGIISVAEGATVIDVGTTRVPDASRKSGFRLNGDVKFDEVAPKCSFITPVPGGVGPMTICSLMKNTLAAGKKEYYK